MKTHLKGYFIHSRSLWFTVILLCSLSYSSFGFQGDEAAAKAANAALKTAFRAHYGKAVEHQALKLQHNQPIIIQSLLDMSLLRPAGDSTVRSTFKMDRRVYRLMADSSHPPLAIFSILSNSDYVITGETKATLTAYQELLAEALRLADAHSGTTEEQRNRFKLILKQSIDFIAQIVLQDKTDSKAFQQYAHSVQEEVERNLYDAALNQLDQYKAQMERWKLEYPNENWEDLRVLVLGFHQPRNLYVTKQFFQWLLNEPGYENKVVYAEFQQPFFGKNAAKAEKMGLRLLYSVEFDRAPSYLILGDSIQLQTDVMGPAAQQIIKTWPKSGW